MGHSYELYVKRIGRAQNDICLMLSTGIDSISELFNNRVRMMLIEHEKGRYKIKRKLPSYVCFLFLRAR